MSSEERVPILQDSGAYSKTGVGGSTSQVGPQHLIIQPIEFNHKHRNVYGYLALATTILVLINYLMISERTCQISLANGYQNYDLIQGFHMTTLIVAIVVFVLSYFNFAEVIYEFKLLFYAAAAMIFTCAGLLLYNTVTITTAPCVPIKTESFLSNYINALDSSAVNGSTNVFHAHDGIGITVFIFDLLSALLMLSAGARFYRRC